nr:protein FAM210B, mitochondrial-like [Leptinotarsa decemlineata]
MIFEVKNAHRLWNNLKIIKGLNNLPSKTLYQNQKRMYTRPALVQLQPTVGAHKQSVFQEFYHCRNSSTESKYSQAANTPKQEQNEQKVIVTDKSTLAEKLKKAVKEYGSTVIVFHVGISLLSLGTCYLLVSAGLDVAAIFKAVGLEDWTSNNQLAASAGTFAVAYAVHKVFAPARIAITLGSVPFIVRYLRKIGFLKK